MVNQSSLLQNHPPSSHFQLVSELAQRFKLGWKMTAMNEVANDPDLPSLHAQVAVLTRAHRQDHDHGAWQGRGSVTIASHLQTRVIIGLKNGS
jgi:hypothetical protein